MRNNVLRVVLVGLMGAILIACSGRPSEVHSYAKNADPAPPPEPHANRITEVSMVQLIANPEKYHGQIVHVIGFVHLEFEGNVIYLHHEDFQYRLDKNGLCLSVTEEIWKERDKYNNEYVIVEGTFNAENHGHFGLNSGTIENIKEFRVWAKRKNER